MSSVETKPPSSNTNNEDRPGIPPGLIMFLGALGVGAIIFGIAWIVFKVKTGGDLFDDRPSSSMGGYYIYYPHL